VNCENKSLKLRMKVDQAKGLNLEFDKFLARGSVSFSSQSVDSLILE
jgi:hypothetical protein